MKSATGHPLLPLNRVVIGCSSEGLFSSLSKFLDLPQSRTQDHSKSKSNSSSSKEKGCQIHSHNQTQRDNRPSQSQFGSKSSFEAEVEHSIVELIFAGQTITVECNKPVPTEIMKHISLPLQHDDDYHHAGHSALVIGTTPFRKGYISHSTEMVLVYLNDMPDTVTIQRVATTPIVSDFVTHYHLSAATTERKILINAHLLKDSEEFHEHAGDIIIDTQSCVYIGLSTAHRIGVMDGSLVKVKLNDNRKRKSRYTQVMTVSDTEWEAALSPILWCNLGGDQLCEAFISIKRDTVDSCDSESEMCASSCSAISCPLISVANKITVAQVCQPKKIEINNLADELRAHFSLDRYMCVGDAFVLKTYTPTTGDENILMKVVKINNSKETNRVYVINSKTTFYEGPAVNSFILPSNQNCLDKTFQRLRHDVAALLRPFIRESWNPHPLPFLLLAGPSGSGKSLIVRDLANKLSTNFIEMNCVHLVADTINSTETRIKNALVQAQAVAPCVLLLRNIHLLAKEEVTQNENPRIAELFETQMRDVMETSSWPIIVFGSCDKIKSVSEGIRELSLHEIHMESPDLDERIEILSDLTANLHIHPSVSITYLAEHTAGFLYGDLEALIHKSLRVAVMKANRICEKELGYICPKTVSRCQVLITVEETTEALQSLQSEQSLDLGTPKIPNVLWADIGGLESVKEDILDTIQLPLQHPEMFNSGLRRSGVLLYGPPGTGKTLLAKAVATECSLNFFSVKGPELINMYVGQSEENVREVFQKARSASPCVIFFDELDSLAPNRGRSGDSGGVMDRLVSQLLAELDGLHKSCDVFVIGATNRPDLLDPALLRPGRFDKLVYVGISSSVKETLTILKALTRKFTLDADCALTDVAAKCVSNMTGADLYSVCADAMTNAIKRQIDFVENGGDISDCKVIVNQQDFLLAVENTTPSLNQAELNRYEAVRKQFSLTKQSGV